MRVLPDQLDLEALKDLEQHRGWKLYRERQAATLAQLAEQLLHAKTWEDTVRLQARIEQVRLDAKLPNILAGEIRGRRKP